MGRMNLLEEVEGIGKLASSSEISKKAIEINQLSDRTF